MTISQLFGLSAFLALTFILCYVGPDFIRPSECMFGGECNYHPVNGNSAPGRKRSLDLEQMVGTMSQLAKRRILRYGTKPTSHSLPLTNVHATLSSIGWSPLTSVFTTVSVNILS